MATERDEAVGRPPWYGAGLRFECQPDCGACCRNHGDYAYVYLEPGEAERIAEFVGEPPERFRERYMDSDEGLPILRMDQPDCPFLEGARCGIYDVRPRQCRTFPFWEENLARRRDWERLRSFCPGIDRGPLHAIGPGRADLNPDAVEPTSS